MMKMNVVELSSGQSLIGYSGTEIILRSGAATVIDSELGGLCDFTAGSDLAKPRMRSSSAPVNTSQRLQWRLAADSW